MAPRRSARGWAVAIAAGLASLAFAASADASSYVVLYKGNAVPASAKADIASAGGTLVQGYSQIGVAIARSDSSSFSSKMSRDSRVDGVASTAGFASKLNDGAGDSTSATADPQPGSAPASDTDAFSGLQWDMRQMHVPQAHAITGGSPAVRVGDIDTGLDYTHPDLAQNVDDADSVNCLSGAPVPGKVAAMDDNGHGTHTAGTIAAASNGIGIVGVAPNVKVAGIKAGDSEGFFFPEAVICAFVWSGDHHLDVTSNSYFADPWEYNCRNDATQRAIWKAEQRAIKYAQSQGVTVVAAAGNDADDLSHPSQDVTSPDNTDPVVRTVGNDCVVIPVEISGVVGVSATGSTEQGTHAGQYADNLKSFYSSYGVSAVDVTAPGGDSRYFTPESVNGRVLSTWPITLKDACLKSRQVFDPNVPGVMWCYQQGTSMATPHVAGEAALIVSQFGEMPAGKLASWLSQTADPQACPDPSTLPTATSTNPSLPVPYLSFTGVNSGAVQSCQGGPGHNSWYGNGQADALNAVTHTTG